MQQELLTEHNVNSIALQQLLNLRYLIARYNLIYHSATTPSGNYRISKFKGRGMEFAEVRQYQYGDDMRNIDWRVTARSGKVHTKLYQQEHNRPVHLLIDLSHSMQFATQNAFKAVVALQIASCIAFLVLKSKDELGATILGHELIIHPSSHNKHSILQLLQKLVAAQDTQTAHVQQTTLLNTGLRILQQQHLRGNLIIILSDFFSVDQHTNKYLAPLARANEVLNIRIVDKIESQGLPAGDYFIHDNANSMQIAASRQDIAASYQKVFYEKQQEFCKLCNNLKIAWREVNVMENFITKLENLLWSRRGQ